MADSKSAGVTIRQPLQNAAKKNTQVCLFREKYI